MASLVGYKYQAQIFLAGKIHDLDEFAVLPAQTFSSKEAKICLIYQDDRTRRSITKIINDPEPRRNIRCSLSRESEYKTPAPSMQYLQEPKSKTGFAGSLASQYQNSGMGR
jgi:hypothetical protein